MTKIRFFGGLLPFSVASVLLGGGLAGGCDRQTPAATDSKSLQKHAEELKKQYDREKNNK